MEKSMFQTLNEVNANDKVEKKNGLTYLSWAFAWGELQKRFPEATYKIWKDANGKPFVYDESLGYMCFTTVTIGAITHEMWLPVMDGANKSMNNVAYKYIGAYNKEKTCDAATMFDINKTIMRCLVKNLAMFGLGLYIYAGEDIPDTSDATETAPSTATKTATTKAPAKTASVHGADAPLTPTKALDDLVVDTENWEKAKLYIMANKQLGLEKITQQLQRKYTITAATSTAIAILIA